MLLKEEAALFNAIGSRELDRLNAHPIKSMYSSPAPEGARECSNKLGCGCLGGPSGRSRKGAGR